MQPISATHISDFYLAGISYKKIGAESRGQFAIGADQYRSLLNKASEFGIKEFFVLSTCNRTEIYGFAPDASGLVDLLCSESMGGVESFMLASYIKKGEAAIKHLFDVGAGLDSQILGDYEIIGQIKSAVRISKEKGYIGAFLDRLVNAVLQSSKAIKNQTALSGGTVSVSFAAVQYIRENVREIKDKKILLIGAGKIGRTTCKNMIDYLETDNITLVNRTTDKAIDLANELGVGHPDDLTELVQEADIILVATSADNPIVLAEQLNPNHPKLIIDLSVPCNVESAVGLLKNIELVNVDQLSKLKDATLVRRKEEVPKAKSILKEYINEFMGWCEMRKHVPVLRAVKTKLKEIHSRTHHLPHGPLAESQIIQGEEKIQRVINGMASKLRTQNHHGCHYIEAINEYLATGSD